MCVFPSSREPTRRQTLASPSRTAAYLLPKNPSGRLWLECRPELRNHGVGWVGWVERLRNGGVAILFFNALSEEVHLELP